eukprot:Rmarinus@m.18305
MGDYDGEGGMCKEKEGETGEARKQGEKGTKVAWNDGGEKEGGVDVGPLSNDGREENNKGESDKRMQGKETKKPNPKDAQPSLPTTYLSMLDFSDLKRRLSVDTTSSLREERVERAETARADVIHGLWTCCKNVNPNAQGCEEADQHSNRMLLCKHCGMWYLGEAPSVHERSRRGRTMEEKIALFMSSEENAVWDRLTPTKPNKRCTRHVKEPEEGPWGGVVWPCCGAFGYSRTKFDYVHISKQLKEMKVTEKQRAGCHVTTHVPVRNAKILGRGIEACTRCGKSFKPSHSHSHSARHSHHHHHHSARNHKQTNPKSENNVGSGTENAAAVGDGKLESSNSATTKGEETSVSKSSGATSDDSKKKVSRNLGLLPGRKRKEDEEEEEEKCYFHPGIWCESKTLRWIATIPKKKRKKRAAIVCDHCMEEVGTSVAEKELHEAMCDMYPIACTMKCGATLPRKEMMEHKDLHCPNVRVPCPESCGMYVLRGQLATHLRTCPNVLIACVNAEKGCDIVIARHAMQPHLSACGFEDVPCPQDCGRMIFRKNVACHLEECPMVNVRCTNQCGMVVRRHLMQKHIDEVCPLSTVPCPQHCIDEASNLITQMMRCEVKDHISNTCPYTKVTCPNGCGRGGPHDELGLRRCDVDDHLNECPNALMMCEHCRATMLRKDILAHVRDKCEEVPMECTVCKELIPRKLLNDHARAHADDDEISRRRKRREQIEEDMAEIRRKEAEEIRKKREIKAKRLERIDGNDNFPVCDQYCLYRNKHRSIHHPRFPGDTLGHGAGKKMPPGTRRTGGGYASPKSPKHKCTDKHGNRLSWMMMEPISIHWSRPADPAKWGKMVKNATWFPGSPPKANKKGACISQPPPPEVFEYQRKAKTPPRSPSTPTSERPLSARSPRAHRHNFVLASSVDGTVQKQRSAYRSPRSASTGRSIRPPSRERPSRGNSVSRRSHSPTRPRHAPSATSSPSHTPSPSRQRSAEGRRSRGRERAPSVHRSENQERSARSPRVEAMEKEPLKGKGGESSEAPEGSSMVPVPAHAGTPKELPDGEENQCVGGGQDGRSSTTKAAVRGRRKKEGSREKGGQRKGEAGGHVPKAKSGREREGTAQEDAAPDGTRGETMIEAEVRPEAILTNVGSAASSVGSIDAAPAQDAASKPEISAWGHGKA